MAQHQAAHCGVSWAGFGSARDCVGAVTNEVITCLGLTVPHQTESDGGLTLILANHPARQASLPEVATGCRVDGTRSRRAMKYSRPAITVYSSMPSPICRVPTAAATATGTNTLLHALLRNGESRCAGQL